ncbi:MAG TPA: hypothetical protein VEK07_23750 [Polyangiaceae bacterium]|nr:hypothetical protein [Polyangiaceae bacterium]
MGETHGPKGDPLQIRLARNLLVLLALVLPFEVPLFRLGPLQITTVELSLYAVLAAWGVATALDWVAHPSSWRAAVAALAADPLTRAAAASFSALLVSALAAPSHRAAALKFTLRSLSGILLLFAARSLARPPETARRILLALSAGALLSAATALLELLVPSTAAFWSPFREGTFDVLGLRRPSGVFGYPTMGAMFWEAVMPLLIVTPFLSRGGTSRRPWGATLVAMLGSAVLVAAMLASATRSSLAGALIGCGALYVMGNRLGGAPQRVAAGVVGLIAVSWITLQGLSGRAGSPLLAERMRSWRDDDWLRGDCSVGAIPDRVHAGQSFAVPVTVYNTGSLGWVRSGDRSVQLSYHWKRLEGPTTLRDFEGIRTELPADVPPGGALDVLARVKAPAAEGAYQLQWDLVVEGITWFSQRGHAMAEEGVVVEPAIVASSAPSTLDSRPAPALGPPSPDRSALWRAALVLWRRRPLLGIGPDNFRRSWQAVLSPSPSGQPYTDDRIHANSLYFETLADLGLAGVLALGMIALGLVRLIRAHYLANRLAGVGCGLGAAAFFIHGTLDYFLEFTPLFGLFWLLLGLTAGCETRAALRRNPG